MAQSYPMVQVWFGDSKERELQPQEMFLAVYAAGGGKRNMANFVKQTGELKAPFRTSDVHVYLSPDSDELSKPTTKFFVCRYASSRCEWVPKPIANWTAGQSQLKLIPEWFKAKFWDNKQEKKHPWFMFGILCEGFDGTHQFFTSNAFPVHQYYPTGVKKTDPNDPVCRVAFHKVLKQAPSTTLRPEVLLRKTGVSPPPKPISTVRVTKQMAKHMATFRQIHRLISPQSSEPGSDSDEDRKCDIDIRVTKKLRVTASASAAVEKKVSTVTPNWKPQVPIPYAKKSGLMSSATPFNLMPQQQQQQQPKQQPVPFQQPLQQQFPFMAQRQFPKQQALKSLKAHLPPQQQQQQHEAPIQQQPLEDGHLDAVQALLALCGGGSAPVR